MFLTTITKPRCCSVKFTISLRRGRLINIAAGLQWNVTHSLCFCRGKTAVTKMIILAFQASICLQKSNLYYSNSSFCLAPNITHLRGSSVHFAKQPQPSGFGPLQTHCCSKSRIISQIMSPSCILQAQQPTPHLVVYLWPWKTFFIPLFSKSKVKTTSSSHSQGYIRLKFPPTLFFFLMTWNLKGWATLTLSYVITS